MNDYNKLHCYHVERFEGPNLIAFVFEGKAPIEETRWHRHPRGQFMYLESGTVCVRTAEGVHVITPHYLNWMPPGIEHTVRVIEPSSGWAVFVAPWAADGLPPTTATLRGNNLMRELVHRAASWASSDSLDDEQQRLMNVLMDEMRQARLPEAPCTLPMPSDRRLLRITQALLDAPGDTRTLSAWAAWGGLSGRNFSRLFRDETGLSFAQWRQKARLMHALDQLGHGSAVANVADDLGYATVSAFIAMFRRHLGQSPGEYLRLSSGQGELANRRNSIVPGLHAKFG